MIMKTIHPQVQDHFPSQLKAQFPIHPQTKDHFPIHHQEHACLLSASRFSVLGVILIKKREKTV